MNRKFSRGRLVKLFLTLSIFVVLTITFLSVFSQHYEVVTSRQYRAKSDDCWEKFASDYHYKIVECSETKRQLWLFWLNLSQITPKILVALVIVSLLGFGLYKYLFPKMR